MTRVPIEVAARVLEKSEDFVRWGLRQEKFPFGLAVQTRGNRWSYHISIKGLSEYTGEPIGKIEKLVQAYRERPRRAVV